MDSTTKLDIEKICRVCLQSNLEMKVIFESQEYPTIAQMLSELTIYKVERFDDMPHLICLDCLHVVHSAYKLKQQCERSYRTLMSVIHNDKRVDNAICKLPIGRMEKGTQTEESSMYPCERCQQKFFSYDALRFHRQNEHKGGHIVCRFCSRSFDRIGYLKNHLAVFHPDSGYISHNQCHICKRQFTRREHIKRHLRVVHKIMNDDLKKSKKERNIKSNPENIEVAKREKGFYYLLHNDNVEILTDDEDEKPLADLINNSATAFEIMEVDELEKPLANLFKTAVSSSQTTDDVLTKENNSTESGKALNQTKHILEVIKPPPKRSRGRPSKKLPNCKYSDKSFKGPSMLKEHIDEDDEKAQQFSCKICSHLLTNQNDLENHLTIKHKEENQLINCNQCNKSFNNPSNYNIHKETHQNKLYQCSKCKKSFSTKKFLQKHIDNHDKKRYACKECSQDFLTRDELNNHAKVEGHDKPLLCPECGLRCKTTNILTVHMRRHKGEKPFKCKFCSKGFPRMDDLRIHEKYHTGEKSHFCETCGKGFLRKYNLRIHLRVHTGEKPYKCPHCPQAFSQGNDLKAHIRRHTGERFRCDICNAAFLQAYQIRQHRLQEHGIHEIPPTQRVKKFTSPEEQEKQIQQNLKRERGKAKVLGDSKEECAPTN